jgi:hypothetical protein
MLAISLATMTAPASNSPGLETIGGDHREEVDVGSED